MTAFRRVEDRLAGPRALGILVPPGLRTFVILRPRALEWDLLPLKPEDTSGFCQFGRDEAAGLARRLKQSLEEAACAGQRSSATVLAHSGGFLACFAAQDLHWVVCRRIPGTPYRPLVFSSREEAQRALERLLPFVCPAADAGQEYYFNTQNFVAES